MDALSWAAVGAGVAAITMSLGFATFWMGISQRITEAKTMAEAVKDVAESAVKRGAQTQANLAEFQRYAEKEFANHDDLERVTANNDKLFAEMKSDLRGITMRLDKLLERRGPACLD